MSAPNHEQGAILVLLAIIMTTLVALVSLALDTHLFAAQKTKYEYTVEQAALAGLEEYFNAKDRALGHKKAVIFAKRAAEKVSALNLDTHFTSGLVEDPNIARADLGSATGGLAKNGWVRTGIWDFDGARAGTCAGATCFSFSTSQINAVRVKLRVAAQSPLRIMFRGLMPDHHRSFEVFATAAVIPRRAVFLLDLSRSITRDTHRNTTNHFATPPERLPASEFAFDMSEATAADCAAATQRNYHQYGMAPADALTYGNLFNTEAEASPIEDDRQMHVKDSYQCFQIPKLSNARFAINTNEDKRPEPLSSILEGIHGALKIFESHGIPGDMVGAIGFDDEILSVRKFDLAPADPQHPRFARLLDATDISIPIANRVQHFLFPRYWGSKQFQYFEPSVNGLVSKPMPAMTDLRLGLQEALDMLEDKPGFSSSDNFVILFTDGLHNCPNGYRSIDNQFPCRDDEAYVQKALAEIAPAHKQYLEKRVAVHTFLASEVVAPHTLLRKMGANAGCMWPSKAKYDRVYRNRMINFRGGALDQPPFYMPNWLYRPTIQSGGFWSPLVDPCADRDITLDLDMICNTTSGRHGGLVQAPPYTDDSSRLLCDRQGRSKKRQVEDLVNSLIEEIPFVLVE